VPTVSGTKDIPSVLAASSVALSESDVDMFFGFISTLTLAMPGNACFSNCSRLLLSVSPRMVMPVTLPPGRLILATNPSSTGSLAAPMTIGIVRVASIAARTEGVASTTITSTGIRTSSTASSGNASMFPLAKRKSRTMVFPST
jgi:hypothetical protein